MFGSRTLKRIKRFLIKKVEANRHYITDEHLIFEFNLANFIFLKSIHAELWIDEETFQL